jgi:hypothetical protein
MSNLSIPFYEHTLLSVLQLGWCLPSLRLFVFSISVATNKNNQSLISLSFIQIPTRLTRKFIVE